MGGGGDCLQAGRGGCNALDPTGWAAGLALAAPCCKVAEVPRAELYAVMAPLHSKEQCTNVWRGNLFAFVWSSNIRLSECALRRCGSNCSKFC